MSKLKTKGLARVQELNRDRTSRVKELKAEGKKVIGYLCNYPVLEMLTALDLIPYRILGDMRKPVTKVDNYLPTIVCPFIRSCLDLGLSGEYSLLDGVAMAHVCDVGERMISTWRIYVELPYFHFIDTPHTVHRPAQEQLIKELKDFQQTLESFVGAELSIQKLKQAVILHNQQRALVRELYDLRKPDPPLLSGVEVLQTVKALMSIPIAEGNDLLKEVISEVRGRKNQAQRKTTRLLVWGSIIDDTPLIEMIEELDSSVVMDDTCVGSRAYFPDVELTEDPLEGLSYRYLTALKCPRTFKEATYGETMKNYMADLESKFSYIRDYAKDWNVKGVILQSLRYCDIHGFEVPILKDYLDHIGLPSIYLEHDYSDAALAPLKTRVQAFLEMIG